MTVHVFHALIVDIAADNTLNEINNIIQNIGMIISLVIHISGFPEIGNHHSFHPSQPFISYID